MFLLPLAVTAQRSSLNTYSPYTLYGIGDILSPATANLRSMGGTGVAFRNNSTVNPHDIAINPVNPASYSSMPRKAFILNFEVEGSGHYLKDNSTKSSFNGFNIRNVSILFPVAKKLGFGLSVSPYSSVGYKIEERVNDPPMLAEVGELVKRYEGEGDITQLKFGLGYELFKNFSIGAEMHYYFGYIDRTLNVDIISYLGDEGYYNTYRSQSMDYSKMSFGAGFQYDVISNTDNILTIGGTYRMGRSLKPRTKDFLSSNDIGIDTTYFNRRTGSITLADVYSLGVFYHRSKISVGADYSFSNWGSSNRGRGHDAMRYINTSSVRLGMQYTPNRYDVRRYFNRLTYRVGFIYDEYYMSFKGKRLSDKAVTLGLGIPVKMGSPTNFNVGLEVGRKGMKQAGLVKANYFKVSLGFSLFGEDYWFRKQKYD